VGECSGARPEREGSACDDEPLSRRRGFWTFAVLTWALAMVIGVVGVGLFLRESLAAFVFAASLLTLAVAFWLLIFRRLMC
jgi:hypothetical protein